MQKLDQFWFISAQINLSKLNHRFNVILFKIGSIIILPPHFEIGHFEWQVKPYSVN